jgi:hypothetical protein
LSIDGLAFVSLFITHADYYAQTQRIVRIVAYDGRKSADTMLSAWNESKSWRTENLARSLVTGARLRSATVEWPTVALIIACYGLWLPLVLSSGRHTRCWRLC